MSPRRRRRWPTADVCSAREAAAELGISERRVRALLEADRIPGARKLDGSFWIMPVEALEAVRERPPGRPRKA